MTQDEIDAIAREFDAKTDAELQAELDAVEAVPMTAERLDRMMAEVKLMVRDEEYRTKVAAITYIVRKLIRWSVK